MSADAFQAAGPFDVTDQALVPGLLQALTRTVNEIRDKIFHVQEAKLDRIATSASDISDAVEEVRVEQERSFALLQQLEVRVAGVERRLSMLSLDHEDTRTRLNKAEVDIAAQRTLADQLRDLTEQVREVERRMSLFEARIPRP